eukprot:CAMPEP_0194490986 /NCGR_PEP_ID=MMETSP0253-20130528/10019_1 /TAXON_ID=2966 /ORGANISM="Noctiluca scintillans" /LENGTH=155 /DNA_ID=CAMNT_0039331671 /DNA_START=585 /DNA_END=1052 /DNA_ORIENTATION=+
MPSKQFEHAITLEDDDAPGGHDSQRATAGAKPNSLCLGMDAGHAQVCSSPAARLKGPHQEHLVDARWAGCPLCGLPSWSESYGSESCWRGVAPRFEQHVTMKRCQWATLRYTPESNKASPDVHGVPAHSLSKMEKETLLKTNCIAKSEKSEYDAT